MESVAKYVGLKIKEYRKKNNLTQEELGKKIGVGLSTISGYERGSNSPDNDKMYTLSKVLGVSVSDFFPPVENDGDILNRVENKFNNKVSIEDMKFLQELASELNSKEGQDREGFLRSVKVAIQVHKNHLD